MSGSILNIVHIDKKIKYDGSQLKPHFIYKSTNLIGDAAVSFIGPCDIPYTYMVDLEDVLNKDAIYSKNMLHFIFEFFSKSIYFGVLFQNAIISEIQNELLDHNINIEKKGDDLYLKNKKLSISIATVSIVSCLIHVGINIDSKGTPVKTVSLNDLKIDVDIFRKKILNRVDKEYRRIILASSKVKAVS